MQESRIDATDRLRREGRWAEASLYRDEVRKQLRAEGKSKVEANEMTWEAMIAKYPPLESAEPAKEQSAPQETEELDIEALLKQFEGNSPDLPRDTLWTYENLENKLAAADNAPSLGAWSLLKWAREYRNRFFEQVLPKAMAARPTQDDESRVRREAEKTIEELDQMIEKVNLQMDQELAENTSQTVRKAVRSKLFDWSRRFALNLPADAEESLRVQMAHLVDQCVAAVVGNPKP